MNFYKLIIKRASSAKCVIILITAIEIIDIDFQINLVNKTDLNTHLSLGYSDVKSARTTPFAFKVGQFWLLS
jgi:hypothetical protein